MSLYAWIIICSLLGPFLLSFDQKVRFYTYWKSLFPSVLLVAICFIAWDEYFTRQKIWGFNPDYLLNLYWMNLPLEEISFFLVVPYACIFIYEVTKTYFSYERNSQFTHYFAITNTLLGLILVVLYWGNWYTTSACGISSLLTVGIYFLSKPEWFAHFVISFLIVLFPFLVVNGILTGSFTEEPIVWYSKSHIIGLKMITIPVEDLFYNYDMLLPITALYEMFKKRFAKKV